VALPARIGATAPVCSVGTTVFSVPFSQRRPASEGQKATTVEAACCGASSVKRKSDFCDPGWIGAA